MQTNALLKEPLTPGTCEWCGKVCELEDVACSLSCEAQLHRLEAVQGRAVLRGLKRWRRYRGARGTAGEGLLTEISALVDAFLRADRERREAHQLNQRRAAQKAAAEAASAPEKAVPARKAKTSVTPVQTSAPVTTQPDWRDRGMKTEDGYNG